jgi:hypothetical protein
MCSHRCSVGDAIAHVGDSKRDVSLTSATTSNVMQSMRDGSNPIIADTSSEH